MKAKKWILANHFDGFPKETDLILMEEELPELNDGDVLIEALYCSVDPYMRPFSESLTEGATMIGQQVARIIKSENNNFAVGSIVLASVGWRSHTVVNPLNLVELYEVPIITPMPDLGTLPLSLALGTLGMTGMTAYFGFLRICKPKSGETVLVNSAAGAVGSVVGQIAKIKGCKVIGFTGTDAKCDWLKQLGFDFVFNYKTCDVRSSLKEAAPEGIDCYFDNVGGDFTNIILSEFMKLRGRVAMCGTMDQYNRTNENPAQGPYPWWNLVSKQISMEGFVVIRWFTNPQDMDEFYKNMIQWIKEGQINHREYVSEGFENMQKAFYGLLQGENIGKAIIKC